MVEVAPDVWQLAGTPRDVVNKFVIGDVLIDAGAALEHRGVVEQAREAGVAAHALTHAHIDHYGGSSHVIKELGIPLWVGELDAPAVEAGRQVAELPLFGERMIWAGSKPCKVDRALKAGDEVGGFTVLFTPGHSPGHVSFWRESDRVLLCGDVMWGNNAFLMRGAPREPFKILSTDVEENRRSARRLAELRPEVVCFGHGPVLRDPDAFSAAVARLGGK
jgi:glyoxylase-like metal-dependent hydrolase (beta-lactamase superfamily II)